MRQALKLALEALTHIRPSALTSFYTIGDRDKAIIAIKEALAQPEQEPVAWRFKTGTWWNREVHWRYVLSLNGTEGLLGLEPLYTTPPQRTWVGLTDEDLPALAGDNGKVMELQQVRRFAKAIEAKLKQKNGYAEEKNT